METNTHQRNHLAYVRSHFPKKTESNLQGRSACDDKQRSYTQNRNNHHRLFSQTSNAKDTRNRRLQDCKSSQSQKVILTNKNQ